MITLNTVQGIGDLFWVYQKLDPYVDAMVFNILCTDPTNTVQARAREFCSMLPKVRAVRFVKSAGIEYTRVASTRYDINAVLRDKRMPVDYAVNKPLEMGVTIRDLDAGTRVTEFVDLGLPASVAREDYLCVFVAGAKSGQVWPLANWVPVVRRLAARLGTKRLELIGAAWDRQVQDPLQAEFRRLGYDVKSHVGTMGLPGTVDVIRRARYFLGYQSGLNVLAENYDVPQAMVYFAKLRPMLYTWCKAASVRTQFNAMCFDDDPVPFIDALPLEMTQGAEAPRAERPAA